MKCEKCGSENLQAMRSPRPVRDAQYYRIECKDCDYDWQCIRGFRIKDPEKREFHRKEWSNVKIVPNRFEKERQERNEKIDRGECPDCGGKLKTIELSRDRLVKYRTDCESGCGFKSEGSADPEYFDEKMKKRTSR